MITTLFFVLVLIDQFTKWVVLNHAGTFGIELAHNTGIAFGLFQNQTGFIIAINIAFLVGAWLLRKKLFSNSAWQTYGLWFILAGGTGNCLDRIVRGYVVDFIHLGPIPTFNIADIWVNVGVALLLVHALQNDKHKRT